MTGRGFEKRLQRELVRWQEQGWVNEQASQAILSDIAARSSHVAWSSLFALAGALLLGLGVMLWVAAHWYEMSKWAKLILIFVALAGSQVAYGLCLMRAQLQSLAQGLAFLSVLFFGASVMLVGQMYHVDVHFPDGIALWAGGGLLTAWLLGSQPAMVTSVVLAALWTVSEQFEYLSMNWPLLGYFIFAAGVLSQREWKVASYAFGLLLLLWMMGWHVQPWISGESEASAHIRLFALQVFVVVGCWGAVQAYACTLARAVRATFLYASLLGFFIFTFPERDFASVVTRSEEALWPWMSALAVSVAIYAAGAVRFVCSFSSPTTTSLYISRALVVGLALLLIMEVVFPLDRSTSIFLWNGFFLTVLYWLGELGVRHNDRMIVNHVFVGLLTWILARYFDTFWSLLDRSLFFIVGGVLLLAGGGWLELRRRKLLHHFQRQRLS